MNIKVSVIVVTYNAAATLESTILSITGQSYSNTELIIIDGKSNDDTLPLIAAYRQHIAYHVSEKDNGIYDAMNKGIKASTGDWIIFMGADDVFYSNEAVSNIFSGNKEMQTTDFIYTDVILKSSNKKFGGSRTYNELLERNINHQSIFYKRVLLNKFNGFNTRYPILADYELNLRIFRDGSVIKHYIPLNTTLFNDKGVSNVSIDAAFFEDQLNYLLQTEKIPARDPRLQQYYFYKSFSGILNGKWRTGIPLLLKALTSGKRKLYFFLVSIKFFLSMFGIGKKIKLSKARVL